MKDITSLLNPVAQALPMSGIRTFFGIAASRKDCISLGVGEPDFPTPPAFCKAGIDSVEAGRTGYTANAGLSELRVAISKYTSRFTGVDYDPESEILVTVGASEGLDAAIRAICAPGDEILVPEPCFVCYAPLISLAGGVPVPIACSIEDDFKVTPALLEASITSKTKALILAYPNNPTGAIMQKSDLELLAPIIKKHDLLVISDEIYAELTYDDAEFCSVASLEGMRERTVIVSGFSKYFAMTGWRIGYVCAPKQIYDVIFKIHQYAVMCAPTVAQYVALEALELSFRDNFGTVRQMRDIYDERRKFLLRRFDEIGLPCFRPRGAFYAFPSVEPLMTDGDTFAYGLLDAKNVAVVPGSAFGSRSQNFLRISYAYSIETLARALDLIEEYVNELLTK